MSIPDILRQAAFSPNPVAALRDRVMELKSAGHGKDVISERLTQLMLEIRDQFLGADSSAEDAVMDTLDTVHGWCHPSWHLFPDSAD